MVEEDKHAALKAQIRQKISEGYTILLMDAVHDDTATKALEAQLAPIAQEAGAVVIREGPQAYDAHDSWFSRLARKEINADEFRRHVTWSYYLEGSAEREAYNRAAQDSYINYYERGVPIVHPDTRYARFVLGEENREFRQQLDEFNALNSNIASNPSCAAVNSVAFGAYLGPEKTEKFNRQYQSLNFYPVHKDIVEATKGFLGKQPVMMFYGGGHIGLKAALPGKTYAITFIPNENAIQSVPAVPTSDKKDYLVTDEVYNVADATAVKLDTPPARKDFVTRQLAHATKTTGSVAPDLIPCLEDLPDKYYNVLPYMPYKLMAPRKPAETGHAKEK